MDAAAIATGDHFDCDDGRVLWTALGPAVPDPDRPGFVRVRVKWGEGFDGLEFRRWLAGTQVPVTPKGERTGDG